jgi:aspartate/methionine/tyrosine aminotransferase
MQHVQKSLIRRIFDAAPPSAINLGLGEVQFPMPAFLQAVAQTQLQSGLFPYTPNAGLPALRQAVAQYYQHSENPEGVCITNGAEEAIFAILTAYLNPGDEVILFDPGYSAYATIAELLGAKVNFVNLDAAHNFTINRESLEKAILNKPRLLLFSHPSNPTGVAIPAADISWLRGLCMENNVLLVVDEVYREL